MNQPLKNILSDPELYFLLLINGVMVWLYYHGQIDPVTVLWIFYFQNILIGIQYFIRMMMLKNFSTENYTLNGKPVTDPIKVKRGMAFFFALHYGAFHIVYFIFLVVMTAQAKYIHFDSIYFNTAIAGFAVNTIFSLVSQVKQDREVKASLSGIMFTPYLRVVPMHLFLIFGFSQQLQSANANSSLMHMDPFTLFLLLKTLSDVLFYIITNKTWKIQRPRLLW